MCGRARRRRERKRLHDDEDSGGGDLGAVFELFAIVVGSLVLIVAILGKRF
jgi:hypothetical protein